MSLTTLGLPLPGRHQQWFSPSPWGLHQAPSVGLSDPSHSQTSRLLSHIISTLCYASLSPPPQSFGSTIHFRPDYSKSYLYLWCIPLSLPLLCLPTFLPHLNRILSFTSGHCRGEVPTHTNHGNHANHGAHVGAALLLLVVGAQNDS